jgi:hypothetical protein
MSPEAVRLGGLADVPISPADKHEVPAFKRALRFNKFSKADAAQNEKGPAKNRAFFIKRGGQRLPALAGRGSPRG